MARLILEIATKEEIEGQLNLARIKHDNYDCSYVHSKDYYYGVCVALRWVLGFMLDKPVDSEELDITPTKTAHHKRMRSLLLQINKRLPRCKN